MDIREIVADYISYGFDTEKSSSEEITSEKLEILEKLYDAHKKGYKITKDSINNYDSNLFLESINCFNSRYNVKIAFNEYYS